VNIGVFLFGFNIVTFEWADRSDSISG